MPAERLSMRQIREVLRLRLGAASCRSGRLPKPGAEPGRGQRLSQPGPRRRPDLAAARGSRRRAARSAAVPAAAGVPADQRPMPDWAWVHRELRRPNVTLALLWEEYRAGAPTGSAIPGSAISTGPGPGG